MIDRDKARAIVAGLSLKPFYRMLTSEGKTKLITAIEQSCDDVEHASRLEAELDTFDAMPSLKEIRQAAKATSQEKVSEVDCPICGGTGWAPVCDGVERCEHTAQTEPELSAEEKAAWATKMDRELRQVSSVEVES